MVINHPVYYPLYDDKEHFIILVTGGRGCENPNQEVIMSDLSIRRLKDVKVGDLMLGDDFQPRRVLDKVGGRSEMFRVHQNNAEDYFVNADHILTLKKGISAKTAVGHPLVGGGHSMMRGRYPDYASVIDMPIGEFVGKSEKFKNNFFGFKSTSIPYPEAAVEIEPYMLGLWLGDGTTVFPNITNGDEEVVDFVKDYCSRHGQFFHSQWQSGAYHIRIVGDGRIGNNDFLNRLKAYGLIGNKHIPQSYISNSETVRLSLLAGLIDTDGNLARNAYEIIQKSERLARQIKYIADTLGFRTSLQEKRVSLSGKDYGIYYRIYIGGDIWRIPCKVKRKIVDAERVHKNKDWRISKLTITSEGIGDWCGVILDGNHRYLHADGTVTHNSGKSFGVATFIERLTFELGKASHLGPAVRRSIVHNVLYSRYTMVSANISVIPEFLEKVEADGTAPFFSSTKSDIVNRMTGSKIMFRGIKTSSGNQTAKLKSIHGITTFVCDEAEEWTSEREFETIAFSIRQPGIQNRVIIIMNPTDSNHFIYEKYIRDTHRTEYFDGVPVQISTHPQVLHIHTTYLDNLQNLSAEFIRSAQEMKASNPERYAHVFMGQWADVAEGAIFKHWGVVAEFPSEAHKVALGLDFGFSHDPSACVRCGIVGNDLYLDEVFYKTGMGIKELTASLRREDLFVYADSADPRLIDEISHGGVIIYPVAKPAGSVIAGIEKMRDFDNIFVTRRSLNLQQELRNYVWARDKNGNYINYPEDHDNHACDAVRYYINGHILGQVLTPRNVSKAQTMIF